MCTKKEQLLAKRHKDLHVKKNMMIQKRKDRQLKASVEKGSAKKILEYKDSIKKEGIKRIPKAIENIEKRGT